MITGVIGLGVVGNSIYKVLQKKNVNVSGYDKYNNRGNVSNLKDILNTNLVFLCLPTEYDDFQKKYNTTALDEILTFLSTNNYMGFILIKSTVEPMTCIKYHSLYKNLNIIHNPEFISAATAETDFEMQQYTLLGKTYADQNIDDIVKFYKNLFININVITSNSTETEIAKIAANSFYATKIQYFNEIYELCNTIDCSYNNVRNMMLENNWINKMHTDVPGSDGKISYGGMCFPKDTNALCQYMKRNNINNKVLTATIEENKIMRS